MLSRSLILAIFLLFLIRALCFAQATGSVLMGQGAGVAPSYTTTPALAGTLTLAPTASGGSPLLFGSSTAPYASLNTTNDVNSQWAAGAYVPNGSTAWTATATGAVIQTMAPGALSIAWYVNSGLTVGNTFTPTQVGALQAIGVSGNYGLYIPNNTGTGLQVGDSFIASVGGGNANFSAGTYYNGSAWVASTTQSIYGLVSAYSSGLGFSIGAAATAGNPVSFTLQENIDGNGVHVGHMYGNVTGFTGGSVSNGSRTTGSTDSFGYILESAWPVTLTFSKAFGGNNVGCVANALGYAGIMYPSANSQTAMTFNCVTGAGATCATSTWFSYHCFGM